MHTAQPEWNSTHIVFALERNRAYHMPFGLYTLRIDRCARLSHEQRDRAELVPGKSQTRSWEATYDSRINVSVETERLDL